MADPDAPVAESQGVHPARGAIRCRQAVVVRRIIAAYGTDVWTASECDCLPDHHCLRRIPPFQNGKPLLCVRSEICDWLRSKVTVRLEPADRNIDASPMQCCEAFVEVQHDSKKLKIGLHCKKPVAATIDEIPVRPGLLILQNAPTILFS